MQKPEASERFASLRSLAFAHVARFTLRSLVHSLRGVLTKIFALVAHTRARQCADRTRRKGRAPSSVELLLPIPPPVPPRGARVSAEHPSAEGHPITLGCSGVKKRARTPSTTQKNSSAVFRVPSFFVVQSRRRVRPLKLLLVGARGLHRKGAPSVALRALRVAHETAPTPSTAVSPTAHTRPTSAPLRVRSVCRAPRSRVRGALSSVAEKDRPKANPKTSHLRWGLLLFAFSAPRRSLPPLRLWCARPRCAVRAHSQTR